MNRTTFSVDEVQLAVGQEVIIATGGNVFQVLDADGSVEVSLEDSGFSPLPVGVGIGGPTSSYFRHVAIRNTSGAENTVRVYIGVGEMRDARLNISGTLSVDNADVLAKLDEISAAHIASNFVDLSDYTIGSTQTAGDIVTAAENINGVKVSFLSLYSSTGGDGVKLLFNGIPILMAGEGNTAKIENVILPSGGAINFPAGGSGALAAYALKVLT